MMGATHFANKVAVITGGASGIGAAIGERFGKDGAKIALLDFDPKMLAETSKRFRDMGIEVLDITCDVTDEKQCDKAIKSVLKKFGGIDILVNNAGITQRSLCKDTSMKVYRKVMEVNFFGCINCTLPALDSIIARKGTIVVTTSIAGIAPLYGRTGYSASKHALHGFYESLRTELKDAGAHVIMLCPGFTVTNLQSRALDGKGGLNTKERSIPGQQDTPEQVAEALYRGVLKRKRILVLSRTGKLSHIISKFFPGLYDKLMMKSVRAEFDE